jgi:hypothetical protein
MERPATYAQPIGIMYSSAWKPSWMVESGYYLYLSNMMFGALFGISVPLIGGGVIAALAGVCIWRQKSEVKKLLAPIALLLGCAVSFIMIQIVLHDESITGDSVRSFIIWILSLILVRSLCLRPGLGHRFTIVLFLIGVMTLPYMGFKYEAERAFIDEAVSGNMANANGLAEWFGFCAVYFGVLGLENKRGVVRILSLSAAAFCLIIVGLTVSRGTLAATAVGLIIASRRILKRGFVPLLILVFLTWIVSELGIFQSIFAHYSERATEDTGRFKIWAEAVRIFFNSPFMGMGASNASIPLQGVYVDRAPHNSFVYLAVASGVVPLVFFVWFWKRALWRSWFKVDQFQYGPFRTPLLMYIFVTCLSSDLTLTMPWGLLGVVIGAGVGVSSQTRRFLLTTKSEGGPVYKLVRGRPEVATPPVTR